MSEPREPRPSPVPSLRPGLTLFWRAERTAKKKEKEKGKKEGKGGETRSHPLPSFAARSADAIRQSIEIIYNGRSLKGKTLETTQCVSVCVNEVEFERGGCGEFVKRNEPRTLLGPLSFGRGSYQLQLHRCSRPGASPMFRLRHAMPRHAARVILPVLLFIIRLFTAGSCQKSTIKPSIPCARTRATESCAVSI